MKFAIAAFLLFATLISVAAFWPQEYRRISSPDGKYFAVAKYRACQSWLPMFPGHSGDKSGWIVVSKKDGTKIGKADVDMIWMIQDIDWKPATAELPLVVTWKL
jgi:hypothetical protein